MCKSACSTSTNIQCVQVNCSVQYVSIIIFKKNTFPSCVEILPIRIKRTKPYPYSKRIFLYKADSKRCLKQVTIASITIKYSGFETGMSLGVLKQNSITANAKFLKTAPNHFDFLFYLTKK